MEPTTLIIISFKWPSRWKILCKMTENKKDPDMIDVISSSTCSPSYVLHKCTNRTLLGDLQSAFSNMHMYLQLLRPNEREKMWEVDYFTLDD